MARGQDPATTALQIEVVDPDSRPVAGASVFTLLSEQISTRYYEVLEEEDRRPQFFELVERFGALCATDEEGKVSVDGPAQGLEIVARAEGLYAYLTPTSSENPVRIVLERDRRLVLVAVDAEGQRAPGVEMVIAAQPLSASDTSIGDPMYLNPGGCAWIGETDEKGEAIVEHAQCIVRPDDGVPSYAALGIPTQKRECVLLRGGFLPQDPVVFQMPPTGRLVVEGPQQSKGRIHIRRAPDPSSRSRFWSNYTPGRKRPREGKAEYPYVEIGLRIEARAWWQGLGDVISTIAPGPALSGETATIRLETPSWMRGDLETRVVATQRNEEISVRWVALTAARSDNSEFRLCYVTDKSWSNPRLQFSTWVSSSSGEHFDVMHHERHHYETIPREWLERFARATSLEPAFFVRRPASLGTRFTADQESYASGRDVYVHLEIENLGEAPISWNEDMRRHIAASDALFRFTARRDGRELPPIRPPIQIMGDKEVEARAIDPGAKILERAELCTWFDLSSPGDYEISTNFDLHLLDPIPIYSNDRACPAVAGECVDVIEGQLAFSVH
jgi:hypothetical protein